jgi:hypothetical protein
MGRVRRVWRFRTKCLGGAGVRVSDKLPGLDGGGGFRTNREGRALGGALAGTDARLQGAAGRSGLGLIS